MKQHAEARKAAISVFCDLSFNSSRAPSGKKGEHTGWEVKYLIPFLNLLEVYEDLSTEEVRASEAALEGDAKKVLLSEFLLTVHCTFDSM